MSKKRKLLLLITEQGLLALIFQNYLCGYKVTIFDDNSLGSSKKIDSFKKKIKFVKGDKSNRKL